LCIIINREYDRGLVPGKLAGEKTETERQVRAGGSPRPVSFDVRLLASLCSYGGISASRSRRTARR
jgi:hypothetical protein